MGSTTARAGLDYIGHDLDKLIGHNLDTATLVPAKALNLPAFQFYMAPMVL